MFTEDQIKYCEERPHFFDNTGGNPIRELLTDEQNHWFSNAVRTALVECTKAQARLLLKLVDRKVYSVVLLYPEGMTDGKVETLTVHVEADNEEEALKDARKQASASFDCRPEDFDDVIVLRRHYDW